MPLIKPPIVIATAKKPGSARKLTLVSKATMKRAVKEWERAARVARRKNKTAELPPSPYDTMQTRENRFWVELKFTVPRRVHPMSFDACFNRVVVWKNSFLGCGTQLSHDEKRPCIRDMDYAFASLDRAKLTSEAFLSVLASHRLRGTAKVYDHQWSPPREVK